MLGDCAVLMVVWVCVTRVVCATGVGAVVVVVRVEAAALGCVC